MPPPRRSLLLLRAAVAGMALGGFALTVAIFYPGIMTYDAHYIQADALAGKFGDWQSPLMTALWALIGKLTPGPAGIFLLGAGLYWGTFALLALNVARPAPRSALALPLLALTPSAFVFLGVIWRDILLADAWLLAAVAAFVTSTAGPAVRGPARVGALALVAVGILLRPNALLAAPILASYVLWPAAFSAKRVALVYAPAAVLSYALVPLVYYGVFGAERQNPLHSLFVYDLGGITHFTKENQFPVAWTAEEASLVTQRCYSPELWDVYWTRSPCSFVMGRLEGEKIFGTPALAAAWRHAVMRHPLAYLQHRFAVFWNFLTGTNLTLWTVDIDDPDRPLFPGRPAFAVLTAVHDALKPTPLFRIGSWLALSAVLCLAAWPRRDTPAGAYAIGVCGSAIVYVTTYLLVGVAGDFRYGLWAVIASLSAVPVLLAAPRPVAATRETAPA